MGYFANMDIEQEPDREQDVICQAETSGLKDEATHAVPPADDISKPADTKNAQSEQSEEENRKAHEAAEAKRKAEWEEKQRQRKEKEQLEWEKAVAMGDNALIAASVKRLGDATERLTRRNMKLCVTEYIQTLCYEDRELAQLVMHPRKSMINCFHYINRKAREYLEQEMKDNDEKPMGGGLGGDVPDDLCYQWAEEYFRDLDVKEDKTESDKEFVPKPYSGTSKAKPKTKAKTKAKSQPKAETPKPKNDNQLTLFGGAA
ncbi:MAG: hypothetical protein HP058_03095 [Massilimaliae sp.]|nr:hypothetical protein [Massiliimalia sp.]